MHNEIFATIALAAIGGHLAVCPQKFAFALLLISLWTTVITQK